MFKTAESVSPGHPDKMCDQISDAILDACLEQDPLSRVAIEVIGGHGTVVVIGELTTTAFVEIAPIVRRIVGDDSIGVLTNIVKQSSEIAQGVDIGGAGDQGIMVGYATRETTNFMPLEYELARRLNEYFWYLHPNDGKTQITLDDNRLETVVVSWCDVSEKQLEKEIHKFLKTEELLKNIDLENLKLHLNPAGNWHLGGFTSDTGLTGRKLAIDNYGPQIPVGGGAFSGKDPTKVDRSAAYKARQMAIDLLESK